MTHLVLLRHGQSTWNRAHRYTGWSDAPLTATGREQAAAAGRALRRHGITFDICFTSWMERATESARIVLAGMESPELPTHASWRLNERHCGALQDMSLLQALRRCGPRTLLAYKGEFTAVPPPIAESDPRYPGNNPLYRDIPRHLLPSAESTEQALARVLPFWQARIAPAIRRGQQVLVVSHGQTLRALALFIDDIPAARFRRCRLPNGEALIYEMDDRALPLDRYFASSREKVRWL